MAILSLEVAKAAPGYRVKRLIAFTIDMTIVLVLSSLAYRITGKPDFIAVRNAMDIAKSTLPGPEGQFLVNNVFALFNTAFLQTLLIWFIYEVVMQIISSGATIGKLLMGFRIVPVPPERHWASYHLLMVFRSAIKCLFMFLFQGMPFLVACLSMFTNKECRSGFDVFAKTRVVDLKEVDSL